MEGAKESMMTRFEKRIIAALMAVLMCGSMVQAPALTAYAAENPAVEASTDADAGAAAEADGTAKAEAAEVQETEETVAPVQEEAVTEQDETAAVEGAADTGDEETTEEYTEIKAGKTYTYESMKTYKFIPEETGKYGLKYTEYVYGTVLNSDMEYYCDLNDVMYLKKGQTYYLNVHSAYVGAEWSLSKMQEIPVTPGTSYTTKKSEHNTIMYTVAAEGSGWYFFSSDSEATVIVYDENGNASYNYQYVDEEKYEIVMELTAGETCYFQVDPRDASGTSWEMTLLKQEGDYLYRQTVDGSAELTKYIGTDETVAIPDTLGGNTLTTIGAHAFYKRQDKAADFNTTMKNVVIPDTVTRIGGFAFSSCSKLEEVVIPDTVTELNDGAFDDCKALKKVTIGSGLAVIESAAFRGCSGLEEVNFAGKGVNVTRIEYSVFEDCSSLADLDIPDSVQSVGANILTNTAWYNNQSDGMVYKENILHNYKGTLEETKVSIAEGTTIIAGRAFAGLETLTEVEIPEGVTSIGGAAFYDCDALKSVTIPASVAEIGKYAFGYVLNYNIGVGAREEGVYIWPEKLTDFTIYGQSGSAAETYAVENGFTFISTGEACDHQWGSGVITTKPTCVTAGVKTYTCSVCGATRTEEIAATGNHDYVGKVTAEATCATEGVKTYTCSVCGSTKTETIAATGKHDYTWKITKEATEDADGERIGTCKICGKETTEVIPKLVQEVSVQYRTHVQTYGWMSYVSDGNLSGTTGQAKRLEAINIKLDTDADLGIQYTAHCQTYGWLPWSADGEMNGTSGEAKRLEAVKIQLTGEDADRYDVYYRVHAQTYGWLAWTKNGAAAGTAGYAKRLEGIQVVVVPKGDSIDQNLGGIVSKNKNAYISATADPTIKGADSTNVAYRTHVQTYGWQGYKYNGTTAGTTGLAKRLEGIEISLTNKLCEGGIRYKTHVQTYGWGDWKSDGAMSGTSGQAKRLEAIQIQLTGDMAEKYDVYYRVHAQKLGWMGWAKNGESAGTAGYAYRLEAIQIQLVEKGAAAPGSTANAFQEK